MQVMIDNNPGEDVASPMRSSPTAKPARCQNWMQYRLIKMYLERLIPLRHLFFPTSGGLSKAARRVILTNGFLIGEYDNCIDLIARGARDVPVTVR